MQKICEFTSSFKVRDENFHCYAQGTEHSTAKYHSFLPNDEHLDVVLAGAFPESYRKPSDILTKKKGIVTMYFCAVRIGCVSWLTNIRTVLASVENVVLSCCCVAFDRFYYDQNDDLQCSADYQRHTCNTI